MKNLSLFSSNNDFVDASFKMNMSTYDSSLQWVSNNYNQTRLCEWLAVFRHWSMATMSFSAIDFNLIIVVVIWRIMKQQRQTQAQIHLLFLAFSDLSVAIVFIAAATWSWIDPDCTGMYKEGQNFWIWMSQ